MKPPAMSRIEQLHELIKEDPEDPFLRYALGLEHLKMNDLDTALTLFRAITERFPDYLATYYQLGKILETLKSPQNALSAYRAGIQVALQQQNMHALAELRTAAELLQDELPD
jgi:tetratricopeptide (TPR) repeat protein